MTDALTMMIAIKAAEVDDLAFELKRTKGAVRELANTQPGMWAEQLAQLAALCEYADNLPAEFAGFVAKRAR
jgi:hypothetical protein